MTRNPLSILTRSLEDWDIVRIEEIMKSQDEMSQLSDICMDVVPVISGYITVHIEEAGPHLTNCCQSLLLKLSQTTASPKEMLVALLEQMDQFRDSVCVVRLLPALSTSLMRVADRSKSHSWSWALNTLQCHMKTLTIPDNSGLEGLERLSLDLSEVGRETSQIVESVITFIRPLVELVVNSVINDPETVKRKVILRKFLLSILGHPLSYMSLHPEPGKEDRVVYPANYELVCQLVQFIVKITPHVLTEFIDINESDKKFEDDEPLSETSVSTLIYLLLGEDIESECLPSVYTKLYLLYLSSPHVIELLKQTHEMRVHKGLLLLHKLLSNIPPESVDCAEAENPKLTDIVTPLKNVIIYHDVSELRRLGFNCYKLYVFLFNPVGRYTIYNMLLNNVNHSGLLGWTITNLKDTIAHNLALENPISLYTGTSLNRLICPLFKLSHGSETDLLEISDELISTINLATFLMIRDKKNITGVDDLKPSHIRPWSNQLTEGLQLSTAHYQLKLKEGPGNPTDDDTNVIVGGKKLPPMDNTQMKQVILSALHTFDLLQFNLARVLDLLDK